MTIEIQTGTMLLVTKDKLMIPAFPPTGIIIISQINFERLKNKSGVDIFYYVLVNNNEHKHMKKGVVILFEAEYINLISTGIFKNSYCEMEVL